MGRRLETNSQNTTKVLLRKLPLTVVFLNTRLQIFLLLHIRVAIYKTSRSQNHQECQKNLIIPEGWIVSNYPIYLAPTSRRSQIFCLGSGWNSFCILEGGVVAVWCWLPVWGLGRGTHEEAISNHRWTNAPGRPSPPFRSDSSWSLQGSNQSLQAGKILQHAIPAPDSC